ncbi:MAG: ABC transporter substrate-binding protein [Bacillota bacterium]|nr:ABC transporter substrate-binding protein [Bacillota bacterium]
MKRKILSLVIGIAMAASVFTGCTNSGSSGTGSSGDIKIGVIMPLTGSVAQFGQSGKKGLDLLQEETNKSGGILGKKVKFIYEDDEGKAASSVNVAQKLINDEKVVAIEGPLTSTCAISVAAIAQQNKIPMVSGTATNIKVTQAGDYVFRTCFIDPFQGTAVAKFASTKLNAKTATILYNNSDDYSKGLTDAFKAAFEKSGGKVLETETYATNDQDFNAQLTKLKSKNSDVMFLPDYYSTVGVIAKQARNLGIKSTFLGGDGWDSSKLFDIGGTAVDGAYFSDHYSADDTAPAVVEFVKNYKTKYNEVPDAMAALNYDAAKILLQAIKDGGKTDADSIKNALAKMDTNVVSGNVKIDKDRNAVKAAVMIQAKDGKNVFSEKINP